MRRPTAPRPPPPIIRSDATGQGGKLYSEPWIPHVTLAYSNALGPARPVIEALGRKLPSRQADVAAISLVSQAPAQLWAWDPVTEVPFGTGLSHRTESR